VRCKLDIFVFIHWPRYCTVHVYVVIHICDSTFLYVIFVSESESAGFFFVIVDFISVLPLEIQLLREDGWGVICRLNPATFL